VSLGLSVSLHTCGQAFGQFGNQIRMNEEIVLFAPRALTRLLREGERAIQEERYADGISALGMLFDDSEQAIPADIRGQDYFLETPQLGMNQQAKLGYYQKTLKGEALRILSSLPEEGRELLEIEFGVTARQKLEAAVTNGDFLAIAEVARRYPFTFAGYDAQILSARGLFTRGSPLGAAAIYQRLIDYPDARRRYGTALAKAAAISWVTAGMENAAVKTLELSSQLYAGESLELAGQQLPLTPDTDWKSALRTLQTMDRSQPMVPLPDNWMISGGSPSRQAEVGTSMPIANPRWVAKTHSSVPEKNAILNLASAEEDGERVILPKAEVRAVGDLVLVKTTDAEILAVDLKTGLTKWVYYENSAPADLLTPSFSRNGRNATSSISDQLKNRVWGSSAYGRFSCDEQNIYCVTDGESKVAVASRFRRSVPYNKANQLQAISISAEGALQWVVGAPIDNNPNTVTHLDLADAYFLGPPLSYEGQLFCIAEFNGDTRLVVLDPATGNLLWWQQLCSASSQSWQTQAGRKSQAI
jgi:hypothetical protein